MEKLSDELRGRDLLSLHDFTKKEINLILDTADKLKLMKKNGEPHSYLSGKTLGMIFQKSSTRTRVSFEVGMYQLGGTALFLSSKDIQLGRGESIPDTARVLSRYLDGIMIRTFDQNDIEELAKYADIPIINGLTDLLHPCQVLADFQTIREKKGKLEGLKVAFIGDGNNMAHSFLFGCAKMGMELRIASPVGYKPNQKIVDLAQKDAKENKSKFIILDSPLEAVENADVVITDVWTSMGQEEETKKRLQAFKGYEVNEELVKKADKDYLFLHCLPAYRGEEVSANVIDGIHSVVWDEAENRLHAQKAVMALCL